MGGIFSLRDAAAFAEELAKTPNDEFPSVPMHGGAVELVPGTPHDPRAPNPHLLTLQERMGWS